jgi:uncharacterized protein
MSEATLESRLREIVERLQPMRPRFLDRIADAFDLLKPRYGIDLLVYTPEEYRQMLANENPLIEEAEREGRVLFERPAA